MATRKTAQPARTPRHRRPALILLVLAAAALSGCAGKSGGNGLGRASGAIDPQAHTPDFARRPNVPLSRPEVVAITLREWRMFGQPVDDDPPDTRPVPLPSDKPERQPGLWQRVGEYWWTGMDAGAREGSWTGKHDDFGVEFPATSDANYPWSAAFISYVMRIAGAGTKFPYSAAHSTYINAAYDVAMGRSNDYALSAERADAYAPLPGDIICTSRGRRRVRYEDLPTSFPAHCQIVVEANSGQLSTIGGNVDDAVTMIHVPTTPDGKLAYSDGTVVDTRYPWFTVLRVLYTNNFVAQNLTLAPG